MFHALFLAFCITSVILDSNAKFQNPRINTVFKTRINKRNTDEDRKTLDVKACDTSAKYRTANGQCNNLKYPLWGSAMYCEQRLLPPYYNGSSEYRESVEGGPLPCPRTLSLNLHFNRNRPSSYFSQLYVFFGLLIAHDVSQVSPSREGNADPFGCCPFNRKTSTSCKPIPVPEDDPFYKNSNVSCLSFERSIPCSASEKESRKLLNKITSFIDASFAYGSSEDQTMSLRTNDGTGRLKVQKTAHGDLLPKVDDPEKDACSFPERGEICFKAGDGRVNQNPVLTSLQTIFVREHNRIVKVLADINPHWDGETLFQETRRIVGAQVQNIVYNEYLPITLDQETMSEFQLKVSDKEERTTYDPNTDPSTIIEFATAAFRFGHSLINSPISSRPLDVTQGCKYLKDVFFRPFGLYKWPMGLLMEEVSSNPSQKFDRYIVQDVTNYLYRSPRHPIGLDLASLDISRGRDHGLPPYIDLVKHCTKGDLDIKTFDDLVQYGLMHKEEVDALKNNYKNVKDIDLRPALLMEIPRGNSVVGPTSACVIGIQFHNLKFGDRFYFEHKDQSGSFTDEQLEELKKASLSTVICSNTDTTRLPRNVMLLSSSNNPIVECKDVISINLNYWKEQRS